MMKIAFIGGGNMGEAMLSAILNKGLAVPADISVSDPSESRRSYLSRTFGVSVTSDNLAASVGKDIVILAIKPQTLPAVMDEVRGGLKPSQFVFSIIAGATIKSLRNGLNHKRIVRVMPNTPAQIGLGMSVWTATAEVTQKQHKAAAEVLQAVGEEIYVEDEKYLDMATSMSGSGPAYFFLFLEALADAGVGIGFNRETAEKLALKTMLGAGHLVEHTGKSPADLRRAVTSPGGTTAEAISVFEKEGLSSLVSRAVRAAYEKARSLGGETK